MTNLLSGFGLAISDLDGLVGLMNELVDFKNAGDQPLWGAEAVRRQYQ